jgi:uncharacterized protein (DUF362 family)/NAD-dependent dihydropyrimidine dehydrogenase PreA subunit
MSKVLVIESTYDNCREAVEKVFAAFPIAVKGKRVAVKINALKSCDPDQQAMVTHYRMIQAVVDKLETLNPAEILVGDSVGTESYGNSEKIFTNSRLKEGAGKYYRNFNKNLQVVELERPFKRKVAVLKDVMDADVYISVPKMKTHGLTRISGSVKNNYGLLTGAQKSWYHYYSVDPEVFARIVVEMYRLRKPDLVIMDAILAMEGYGPASPETRWVNKVLAATDGVALDTVQTQIVGFQFEDVPYLRLCREMNLGETDINKIEIVGDASPIVEYHRPTPPNCSYSYKAGVGSGTTSIDFYRDRVAYRSVITPEKCRYSQGCRDCIKMCPSGSLMEGPSGPAVEPANCFICSACKEACNFGALELTPHAAVLESLRQYEGTCK